MFYKIAEYDLNWEETWRLETTSPSQMAVQKTLPLNETPHELSGNTQKYLYNSKLHLAGVQERFCDAYNVFMHAGRNWEKITQITAVVTLETDDGKKTVVRNVATPQLFKQGEDYYVLVNNQKYKLSQVIGVDEAYQVNPEKFAGEASADVIEDEFSDILEDTSLFETI
jgi:hypothetical protein